MQIRDIQCNLYRIPLPVVLSDATHEDIARVQAMRELIGPDVVLMVDANRHMNFSHICRRGVWIFPSRIFPTWAA